MARIKPGRINPLGSIRGIRAIRGSDPDRAAEDHQRSAAVTGPIDARGEV